MITKPGGRPKLDGARLISGSTELVIGAINGNEPINEPGFIFTGFAAPRNHNWSAFALRRPTPPTPAAVYELIQDRSIRDICCGHPREFSFDSFLQIKMFCATHPGWLRGEFATLFLFRVGAEFLFADAYVLNDGLVELNTDGFDFPMLWAAKHQPRIVVPASH